MLRNRSKCKPIKESLIQEHGVTITDSEDIANRFCQLFANVSPNLASKIIPLSQSFNVNPTLVSSSSLQNFDYVKINELFEVLKNFKDGKVPGLDNLPRSTILSVNHCWIFQLVFDFGYFSI